MLALALAKSRSGKVSMLTPGHGYVDPKSDQQETRVSVLLALSIREVLAPYMRSWTSNRPTR